MVEFINCNLMFIILAKQNRLPADLVGLIDLLSATRPEQRNNKIIKRRLTFKTLVFLSEGAQLQEFRMTNLQFTLTIFIFHGIATVIAAGDSISRQFIH